MTRIACRFSVTRCCASITNPASRNALSGISLQHHRIFYLIEIAEPGDAIVLYFKFEMIQRMAAHEHARHFFFMVQQFGQCPGFAIRNFWRL